MSNNGGMTLTEFLDARLAEDEKTAKALLRDLAGQVDEEYAGVVDEKGPMTPARLLSAQMWAHYDGQSKRRSFAKGQQIATLANPERVLAECAAKRAIVDLYRNGVMGEIFDGEKWTNPLAPLAAIYKDHPDYQQECSV